MPQSDEFARATSSTVTSTRSSATAGQSYPAPGQGGVPVDLGSGARSNAVDPGDSSRWEKSAAKETRPVDSPKKKRMQHVRSLRSPKGHRVKLVGDNLGELAPLFVQWSDRLDKDLRVVVTDGEPPYQFYGRPMVAGLLTRSEKFGGTNGVCLMITGTMQSETKDDGAKWRVGLDEMLALKAPPKLDSPEFPAFANIHDEKKVFIGRVDGKFIYTMLYIPQKEVKQPEEKLPSGLAFKLKPKYESDPRALEPFIAHVLGSYERMMRTHAAEIHGAVTGVSFSEFCGDSRRKRQRTIQETIDRANREMRDIEQSMTRKARELREAQKDLTLVMSGALDVQFDRESEKLNDLVDKGLYQKFKIRHGVLIGMTTPVIVEFEKKKFDLGCFMVSIAKDGTLKIEHPTKAHPFHPHISSGANICLGSFRNDVHKLIGLERYAVVFQVLYEFLHAYNPEDRYTSIEICSGVEVPVPMQGAGAVDAPDPVPGVTAAVVPTPMPIGNATVADAMRAADVAIQNAVGIPAPRRSGEDVNTVERENSTRRNADAEGDPRPWHTDDRSGRR